MPYFAFIGLAGGIASAVLFVSALHGGPMALLLLHFLTPLPSFIAGLGWGAPSALVAALTASAGIGIALGSFWLALLFLLSQGLPIVILCHLALLHSQADTGGGADSAETTEWYPIGRLLAAASIMAGGLSVLSLFVLGGDLDEAREALRETIDKVFAPDLGALREKPLTSQEIDDLARMGLYILPAATATSWLACFGANMWLAGRITHASGHLVRPWPDLAAMTFPPGMAIGLGIAMVFTYALDGYPRLISSGFAGAVLFAHMLMGLAIIHYVTRGKPHRPLILWGVYFLLLLFNSWIAPLIALLAIIEPISPLKRWATPPAPPGPRGPD